MYEKTDKTTVVYYSKLQYTLQQTTIYTLEYQCKYFNITGTIIIGVNPSGGSDSAIYIIGHYWHRNNWMVYAIKLVSTRKGVPKLRGLA